MISALAAATLFATLQDVDRPTLVGFASIPAGTFVTDIPSGHYLGEEPINGWQPPFEGQPVQGISALIWDDEEQAYLGLADNGYGSQANSADFVLTIYRIDLPGFGRGQLGHHEPAGEVEVEVFTHLKRPDPDNFYGPLGGHRRDPFRSFPSFEPMDLIPFYRGENLGEVPHPHLSGSNFDVESLGRDQEGNFWVGDEFGPFLLEFSATGELLSQHFTYSLQTRRQVPPGVVSNAVYPIPVLLAPESRGFGAVDIQGESNYLFHPRSGGFEGLALSVDGESVYAMLEKPTRPDVTSALAIYKFDFDFKTWQYQGQDQILHWLYPVEEEGNAIGELTAVNENQFLVIERDGAQGPEAETKKVFLITLGEGTQVEKELLVDLLEIDNPQGLGGFEPGNFRFPFTTIEAVEIIDEQTLILCNDNNFPFSTGRGPGVAEDTEFIVVRLPEPLDWTPPNF